MIKVVSPARLHLTLIDLNAEIGRIDGGAGITLQSPGLEISAVEADTIEVTGDSLLAGKMRKAAQALLPAGKGIRIQIDDGFPDHVGLGSGTQAALSAAAAVNRIYGLGKSVRELAVAVGRGGTSGIGVAAFENGGFILDGGHKFKDKRAFSPSAASHVPPGPVLFRRDFPDWPIVLAIPNGKGAHDAEEVDIFKKFCPIPLAEVQEVCHVILMLMLPALVEEDLENFGRAVNHFQTVGFKRREVELQPQSVLDIMRYMRDNGASGSGVSSFGPVVYGIVGSEGEGKRLQQEVQRMLDESIGGRVLLTKARNRGADIFGGLD
ncbi:beta-ribofuranosylaminobenzene 5'-phosphate synthase [Methanosarcina thermophila]|uniref:Beta-ribofuranosylaminobenzene 5'-phosphate synthase n=3 Tax=Methanosarcina thermophila TaxID=2210 RepID=A0A1I6YP27_METTE|nr:beta-ribofuranosylaminobenzene 5'-phosphate synthase [Methanosarcina thermophila]ALK06601.1 MAG: beta-ribofuranosylaminobenzene 5'-phosphate synthase [Methanosarcina sp. 795]AKB13926.1 beta-ribofuranosylaminobenzene 5'-phosphate synthase [Methanosarcina thermophila TM-1]AKB15429.1 beta-ribofuranosylaminobenzene 5'-phosphate synthase [Methanosarcina thermophila CHTI-55]NLU55986.1 beta-ribofuranosylaminobenzene 5'-phosphate synthase [Methanosarcina thermophila]SFT52249.1 beta-ribofuranosylami